MLPNIKYTSLCYTVGPYSLCLINQYVIYSFIYLFLFLAALALGCYTLAFSDYGEWGLLSSCGVRLLTAVASPAAEYGLQREGTQSLRPTGLVTPRQPGIKPMSLALAGGFLTTGPPGKSY